MVLVQVILMEVDTQTFMAPPLMDLVLQVMGITPQDLLIMVMEVGLFTIKYEI